MAIIRRETDYALRVLAQLALAGMFVSVSTLSEETEVPMLFLRKIMQRLHGAGLVVSKQGPFGGYLLAKPAEEVSVLTVLETMQGPLVANACFEEPEICSRSGWCPLRDRLREVQEAMAGQLDSIRISEVAEAIRRCAPGGAQGSAGDRKDG